MSNPIYAWTDGYVELKHRAEALRGSITLNPDAAAWERWPRTTGADVVAIAAFVQQSIARLPDRDGNLGILRRWAAVLADLEVKALPTMRETYVENRSFWRTLGAAMVHLSSIEASVPQPRLWDALIEQLGANETRNANAGTGAPFGPFDNVKSYDEVYVAQFNHLRELRGVDLLVPDSGTGAKLPIPRATNTDVVTMADWWTKQLAGIRQVAGHKEVKQRWDTALADVAALARSGDPAAVYSKNNSFWRALDAVVIQVAAVAELPSDWDRFVDAVGHSIANLPENLGKAAEALAGGVGSAASAVGKGVGRVAGAAGQGFLSGFKTPLIVGGGLLGAYLLFRKRPNETRPESGG
jgi:hypothetical protein